MARYLLIVAAVILFAGAASSDKKLGSLQMESTSEGIRVKGSWFDGSGQSVTFDMDNEDLIIVGSQGRPAKFHTDRNDRNIAASQITISLRDLTVECLGVSKISSSTGPQPSIGGSTVFIWTKPQG